MGLVADGIRELLIARTVKEPTPGELWGATSPQLEKALAFYDKKDSDSLPDTAWLPFAESKEKCRKELDKIIDACILVLGNCGATQCREKIRVNQKAITEARERIIRCREQSLSAPPEISLSVKGSPWTRSRENFEKLIVDEERSIESMLRQIEHFKTEFRNHLRNIGLEVSPDEADSFLLPVQDDIVSMAAVITHVAHLTDKLEYLVKESRELPAHTTRYYGIHVLLVYAIDRIQMHFIEMIDASYLPQLRVFEQDARQNIADAQAQISREGPREQLSANVEAGRATIEAAHFLTDVLRQQRGTIEADNAHTKRMLAAAANTYKTVRLSLNVAQLMNDCQKEFQALRDLQVPRLRPFQNLQLKAELQRLSERMIAKQS
jgi:hypothetical protein